MFSFEVKARDPASRARLGRLQTPHGTVDTPAFMPVGTAGAVKGISPNQLRQVGTQIILANTYHLRLRPGAELIEQLGGLGRFMSWDGPLLTDSGGYQVFSLGELVQIDDEGISFRSHVDGTRLRLGPAEAIAIQNQLGADIIVCLDQCPSYPSQKSQVRLAVQRTVRWARAGKAAHRHPERQWLFGVVQGGVYPDLRAECINHLAELDLPGYAVGGLSVGEPRPLMFELLEQLEPLLPADRPRYLMGVGAPHDIVQAVAQGMDLFDCVLPTRNGRNSYAFTDDGPIRLRNHKHQRADEPIDRRCCCPVCRQFSRAYLRHLFLVGEMLGPMLVSLHNIAYYQSFMERLRQAISQGCFQQWSRRFLQSVPARVNADEETT